MQRRGFLKSLIAAVVLSPVVARLAERISIKPKSEWQRFVEDVVEGKFCKSPERPHFAGSLFLETGQFSFYSETPAGSGSGRISVRYKMVESDAPHWNWNSKEERFDLA